MNFYPERVEVFCTRIFTEMRSVESNLLSHANLEIGLAAAGACYCKFMIDWLLVVNY